MDVPTPGTVLKKVLHKYPLCNACLGRLYRSSFSGLSNEEIGVELRNYLGDVEQIAFQECWLCEGLFGEIDHFCDLVMTKVEGYEFGSFLVGTQVDEDVVSRQQQIVSMLELESVEPVKMALNRNIGKQLADRWDTDVDFSGPDITVVVNTAYDVVRLQLKSVYIYGRYRKFQRGIPQTRWPCRVCRGKGCSKCDGTGKLYQTSVEELVAKPIEKLLIGNGIAFHGCGREDIDALMLGNGRPFVVEIKKPQVRSLDYAAVAAHINNAAAGVIEVVGLRASSKDEIVRLKAAEFRKTYRVIIEGASRLDEAKLKEGALILGGTTIRQFTPIRVAHRRAQKLRERTVYHCTVESVEHAIATLVLETESGTYIKELISGDHGRTQPNLSDLIGIPCIVKQLDVIEIQGE